MTSIPLDTIVHYKPFFCDGCHDADLELVPHLLTFKWGTSVVQWWCRKCSVAGFEVADSRTFLHRLEEIR